MARLRLAFVPTQHRGAFSSLEGPHSKRSSRPTLLIASTDSWRIWIQTITIETCLGTRLEKVLCCLNATNGDSTHPEKALSIKRSGGPYCGYFRDLVTAGAVPGPSTSRAKPARRLGSFRWKFSPWGRLQPDPHALLSQHVQQRVANKRSINGTRCSFGRITVTKTR